MKFTRTTRRSVQMATASAAVLGAVAASLLAAPTASAKTTGPVSVSAASGGSHATSCTYKVSVPVNNSFQPVLFRERAVGGGSIATLPSVTPQNGVATIDWTPSVTGERVIQARQGGQFLFANSPTITVKNGINLGSMCFAM